MKQNISKSIVYIEGRPKDEVYIPKCLHEKKSEKY